MANTQLWVNTGKDALDNGLAGVLTGQTTTFGLSSKAFASFTASDTYATRTEVAYWTGGAALTQAWPASVNGISSFSVKTWNTGAHTDGPNNVTVGLVYISTTLIYVVDLVALVNANQGLSLTVLDMSVAAQILNWTPQPILQNVGGG